MRIAFNPSTVEALITPPNNKDITFDLRGQNIFARGVKFRGTDTNTWRDIKINNVSIDSNTLNLRNGSNTTLTNIKGVVTINSTWRPVVDNLTSNSTTSSLSANQGRILAKLINGKSDSGHNHDDRYLRLTGGWMSGDINFGDDNKIYWGRNSDSASISFKNDGDGDADSYMSFVTSDNGNEYFKWSHSSGSTNTEWMALRSDGLRVGGTKVSLEGHSHNDRYYTKTEVNNKLKGKSDTSHTHDDRYLKLTGGIVNGVVGINATGVCSNSVLTVGPQDKRINTGIVDRYGTMLQIVGTGKKNGGGVIGFHNPGLYSAIIGFVRDTNETGFIFDTDFDRDSWYVKARAFKGNLIGDADSVDGVHMDWSTNYTSGNYLAIWDNAGNCIRPIPKGSTSVGYATSAGNSDTVDGKHASDFASAGHNHDRRYVYSYGSTADVNGQALNQNALFMSTTSGITKDWWHILQAAWNNEYCWNSQIAFPTQNRNGMYYRSGLDDNTAWGSWVKLLDVNNYSSTLDSRYYTESEVNSLLSNYYPITGGNMSGDNRWIGSTMGGGSDYWRIGGSGSGNNGWAEIATADDGNEPIYVRQYTGVFSSVVRTLTLLDGSGNTTFPGNVGIGTTSPVYKLHVNGNIYSSGQIIREGYSTIWAQGRNVALLRETTASDYHTLWSLKTTNGSWDFGEYATSGWNNVPVLSYITDSNYNSGNNVTTYQIKFPLASGTVALTSYGGDYNHHIFLGYLNLDHGNDGTVSSSFYCLGYSVPFTYTRGGNYCKISIPDTSHQTFYIRAAIASVNYSGGGMDTWVGNHRGEGAWWLHCYASGLNEVRVKGFCQRNSNNDSWWGGNPLWSGNSGANRITVCIFGNVTIR